MEFFEASYPGRPHIESYGNGGFRFAGGSHSGSLLFLPQGVKTWDVTDFHTDMSACFSDVFECPDQFELFILGSGEKLIFPNPHLRDMFKANNITLECMNTGAACRTYNVLLSENRSVAAGLIAVE